MFFFQIYRVLALLARGLKGSQFPNYMNPTTDHNERAVFFEHTVIGVLKSSLRQITNENNTMIKPFTLII